MSALLLRIIACLTMLLDHIGYYNGNMLLRGIGRIAFPIFVYLIVNGYRHTSCRWKYALRLGFFALISQLPYSLFCTGRMYWSNGNVFFTLLIALLCVWATDRLRNHKIGIWLCWLPAVVSCLVYRMDILDTDYGARGVLLAVAFYFLDGKKLWNFALMMLSALALVFYDPLADMIWSGSLAIPQLDRWGRWQLYSLLALPLIFLYNGKKGSVPGAPWTAKAVQYGFYLFYPVHLLALWLLKIL